MAYEKGNAIHVVFEKSISPQYRANIIEGRIYTIYNPGCVLAKEWRPVAREDILNVVSGCITKEEEESSADIKRHYFEWCTFQERKARVNTNIFLSDVIGVLTKNQNPDQCNTKEDNAIFSKLWIRDPRTREVGLHFVYDTQYLLIIFFCTDSRGIGYHQSLLLTDN